MYKLDATEAAWATYCKGNPDLKKYRLEAFYDLPLKFLICLTQIFNPKGTYKSDSGYIGVKQDITLAELNKRLGKLADRVARHLKSSNSGNKKKGVVMNALLNATFTIAKERGWITGIPTLNSTTYTIHFNQGYFAKKRTRELLSSNANSVKQTEKV